VECNLHRVLVDKCIGQRKQDTDQCRRRRHLPPYTKDEKMSGLLE
jgi:hypothetical protein